MCPYTGVQGLSLTASREGHYCPHSTAVLTCTASQVTSLAWFAQDKKIVTIHVSCNFEIEDGPYNINLSSCAVDGNHANFTSVMEVMVDDIPNGTNITCKTFGNQEEVFIYQKSRFK